MNSQIWTLRPIWQDKKKEFLEFSDYCEKNISIFKDAAAKEDFSHTPPKELFNIVLDSMRSILEFNKKKYNPPPF